MARRTQSTSTRKSSASSRASSGAKAKAASPKEKSARKRAAAPEPAIEQPRLFDDRVRRDITGVVVAIVAVALLVAAVLPSDAVVTSFISRLLHLTLGLGAFFLPLALFGLAVGLFARSGQQRFPVRLAVGIALILVAVLSLLALATPGAAQDTSLLFAEDALQARGGYVGAGIAWAGLALFGQTVSAVILAGMVLAGLVAIGFSISGLLERARTFREHILAQDEELDEEEGEQAAAVRRPPAFSLRRSSERGAARREEDARPTEVIAPAQPRISSAYRKIEYNRPRRASASLNTVAFGTRAAAPETAAPEDENRTPVFTPLPGDSWGADIEPDLPLTRKLGARRRADDMPAAEPSFEPAVRTEALGAAEKSAAVSSAAASAAFSASSAKAPASSASAGAEVPAEAAPTRVLKPKKKPAAPLAAPHPQEGFALPPLDFLAHTDGPAGGIPEEELSQTAAHLQETLEDFGIMAEVVGWVAGPTVTLFKVNLPAGVRVSRVTALTDDIALALAAPGVRIFAPIPGTNYVGIEVPNKARQTVLLGDVLKDAEGGPLMIAIGKDVEGHSIVSDLAKMPHLLIGGTTGSGKSVSINAMIMSILMRATPAEVRFIMIDPKRVEFTPYNGIPHLYVPVVTEAKEAASALSWGVAEMERRLKVFSKVGARNIGQYNAKVQAADAAEKRAEEEGSEAPERAPELAEELPYIVIIIDELADLMMNVGKEVEFSISRIAQLARAAGIHLIVATQRPSTNVVTGLIKANITNRIAFNVASGIDSRVILDTPGAENLIGLGDMLFSKPEYAKPQRIQGCYVSEDEINAVVDLLKEQGEPEYHSEILSTNLITLGASSPDGSGGSVEADDPLIWEAADIVVSTGLGSTSNIQRRLKVGYSRAGRIMDMLEEKGVVGPPNGSKPRDVLVDALELETLKAFEAQDAGGHPFAEE